MTWHKQRQGGAKSWLLVLFTAVCAYVNIIDRVMAKGYNLNMWETVQVGIYQIHRPSCIAPLK